MKTFIVRVEVSFEVQASSPRDAQTKAENAVISLQTDPTNLLDPYLDQWSTTKVTDITETEI